ncbi:MAG: hypothetical protein GF346_10365 [Candidatus Eisenbacteria bacterium]|nr:hypothetical protein [Candidatus Latescibacterota bacterium]MBD3302839.1 hypothetical protein [Candidatus Eisenbacteria bacterium]
MPRKETTSYEEDSVLIRCIPAAILALTFAIAIASGVTAGDARAQEAPVGVTVVIENLAPENGTWLTPAWVGFHDGDYEAFDVGSAADPFVERLAEDGNTAPLFDDFASEEPGGSQETIPSDQGIPQIAPGESATATFVLDASDPANRFFSYLSMVIPSNDAFIGSDAPQSTRIFDANGNFLGAYLTISGGAVLDAGTEVNDEIPEHTAFFGQTEPDTGVDENGVIHEHPGYNPPGSGGILDDPMFAEADFTTPGYEVARITIYRSDTIVEGGSVSGVWDVEGSPYLIQGDATIPVGETLAIEPNVLVFADAEVGITVQGTIEAIGGENQPIVFTGPAQGLGWRGIRIEETATGNRLEHCVIEHGDRAATYESGGGIACLDSDLVMKACMVRENDAYYFGAGLYGVGSDLVIEACEFRDNLIDSSNSAEGGGIYCEDSQVRITNSRILDNRVETFTFFGATNSRGGGIALRQCETILEKNVIAGNYLTHSGTEAESVGGGIFIDDFSDGTVLRGNTISYNEVHYTNAHGGGIYLGTYNVEMTDNIVSDNVGAGIWFDPGASGTLVEYCDVHGNSDGRFGGGSVPDGLGEIVQENRNGDPCDANFNIFLDPRFVAESQGDFHLEPDSPCIDAGNADSPADPDGTIADIGAFFFDQGTTTVSSSPADETARLLLPSRPEPAFDVATIRYRVPTESPVRLTIHGPSGRVVRTLVDERRPEGVHGVQFDGRDAHGRPLPAGVYFSRLAVSGRTESRRLTLLR